METGIKSVSVVMATYNGEHFLKEQLDSILSQTYPIMELIIQDDCSTDLTREILREYASRYRMIHLYFNEHNEGFKRNFSSACRKAEGEFVALSDQDDIWLPEHIEELVRVIGEKEMACGDALMVDSANRSLGYKLSEAKHFKYDATGDGLAYRIFYGEGALQGASMLLNVDFLKQSLPVPDGVYCHDTWFSAVACFTGGMAYSSKVITRYRRHEHNVTEVRGPSIVKELNRHTHFDYVPDRMEICRNLRNMGIENQFLNSFELYADRCSHFKYKWWCFKFRFIHHYHEIYTSKSIVDRMLRAIHYLLTPSSVHSVIAG